MDPLASIDQVRAFLLRGRNADGGWGYRPGRASRLEPTCWALLALGPDAANPRVLRDWPVEDGLLLERPGGSPNYAFHGIALLVLRALGLEHAAGNALLLAALQRVKGDALPQGDIQRQDNSLQGWSWIAGTFSWAEPTAWCLLALKHWSRVPGVNVDAARIDIAERLLVDRVCAAGGWNYGNSNVLGQELKPYVPTTAVALLSLQDKPLIPAVARSVEFLERQGAQESSSTALALAFLALRASGRLVSPLRDALVAQLPTALEVGNHVGPALALFALGKEESHAALLL